VPVIDEEQLRRMSAQERHELLRALARLETRTRRPDPARERRRKILIAFIIACCVVLAAWTGLLAATLPRYYRAGGWRGAWVGFDIAELAAFAAVAWASWRRRQILIMCLIVLATLLCCDAWFDVVLDARTSGFWLSLASALLVELPLAAVAILAARRLLRTTYGVMRRHQGEPGPVPRLIDIPLIGAGQSRSLADLLAATVEEASAPPPPDPPPRG
jgi:hypothetical protein